MIQLQALSGAAVGKRFVADRFPFTVGRSPECSIELPDPGVFDRHFEIGFSSDGFLLTPSPNAVVTLNGKRTDRAILHNGDVVGAGYAKLQFWLAVLPQRGLRGREILAWVAVAAMAAAQVYLLAWLLRLAR